jgi:hypothetical protein
MRVLAVLGQALRALTFSLHKFNFSNILWSMDEVQIVMLARTRSLSIILIQRRDAAPP